MIRPPPSSPLFPSTPLSRSGRSEVHGGLPAPPARKVGAACSFRRHPPPVSGLGTDLAAPRRSSLGSTRGEDAYEMSRPRLRSEEHTSELQSQSNLVCRLLLA